MGDRRFPGSVWIEPDGIGNIFAKQFLDEGARMAIPKMVYDKDLQMMVDPFSGQPIYENNKEFKLAKVTAGCDDCPKYDEE
jgi:hypothetical protein